MRKYYLFLIVMLFSCNQKTPESNTYIPVPSMVSTDPDPRWPEVEKGLAEVLSSPIGVFHKEDSLNITETDGSSIRTPFNRASYFDVNMYVFEHPSSNFLASFTPTLPGITLNRLVAKKRYEETSALFKNLNIKADTITFERFVNAYLQQELWHSKGNTGEDKEFYSDVISIKIAGEWIIAGSLLTLIGHHNGDVGPGTYSKLYEEYGKIFSQMGVTSKELICVSPKETFGGRRKEILLKHPGVLTDVKNLILKTY